MSQALKVHNSISILLANTLFSKNASKTYNATETTKATPQRDEKNGTPLQNKNTPFVGLKPVSKGKQAQVLVVRALHMEKKSGVHKKPLYFTEGDAKDLDVRALHKKVLRIVAVSAADVCLDIKFRLL